MVILVIIFLGRRIRKAMGQLRTSQGEVEAGIMQLESVMDQVPEGLLILDAGSSIGDFWLSVVRLLSLD